MGGDGDPLDALVMVNEPTFPGCEIEARPVGVFMMSDDKGEDEKVLTVPVGDPLFASLGGFRDVPPHFLREVEHFFTIYKELEDKPVTIKGWEDETAAREIIRAARERAHA